jgi:hypothetical protein
MLPFAPCTGPYCRQTCWLADNANLEGVKKETVKNFWAVIESARAGKLFFYNEELT